MGKNKAIEQIKQFITKSLLIYCLVWTIPFLGFGLGLGNSPIMAAGLSLFAVSILDGVK